VQSWLGYLLVAVPNVVVIVAAFVVGLHPKWVAKLEHPKNKRIRLTIAWAFGIAAAAVGVLSAVQQRIGDDAIRTLASQQSSGFQRLGQQIKIFQEHTPTVPKWAFHTTEEMTMAPVGKTWFFGVNVTLWNDGDDADYTSSVAEAFTGMLTDNARELAIKQMLSNLKTLEATNKNKPTPIRSGENRLTSVAFPIDKNPYYTQLIAGKATAFFGVKFDIKTRTGIRKSLTYCGFYQGFLIVECSPQ
jgi:hypothetical protein